MEDDVKISLMELLLGLREPTTGIEKHFLKVIRNEARPCNAEEREWFEWWKKTHQPKRIPEKSVESTALLDKVQNTPNSSVKTPKKISKRADKTDAMPDRVRKILDKTRANWIGDQKIKILPGSFGSGKKSR